MSVTLVTDHQGNNGATSANTLVLTVAASTAGNLLAVAVAYAGTANGGTISGVTDWGLYVEEKVSAAEGLVRVRTIGNDFYNYSQKEYALVGQRTKEKLTLGDSVRVKLVAADLAARTLDFELVR